jgi:hypothetical protein
MASKCTSFFDSWRMVPPTVCTVCGRNAPCVRRTPKERQEVRTYSCECGNTEVRFCGDGDEPSDARIQKSVEDRVTRSRINLLRKLSWTPESDALLATLARTTTLSRLAVKLRRTEAAVLHRAKVLNVEVKRAPRLAANERRTW